MNVFNEKIKVDEVDHVYDTRNKDNMFTYLDLKKQLDVGLPVI